MRAVKLDFQSSLEQKADQAHLDEQNQKLEIKLN